MPETWFDPWLRGLAAPRVQAPVLQVHCAQDPITPLAHAQALQRAFRAPAQLLPLAGGCHVPRFADFRPQARDWLAPRP